MTTITNVNLLVTEHYFARFYEIRELYTTDRQTYEALEREVEASTNGKNKYSSYESFKQMKLRYLDNLLRPNKKVTLFTS